MTAKADLADILEAILELKAQVAAQARLIRSQAFELAHNHQTFARASEAANMGVWECDLPHGTVRWSDMVYDLFGLPRGSPVSRETTLALYVDSSREELEVARSAAIARRDGFSLDARIITPAGDRRVIRISATVECDEHGEPVRIFGMKQDITEEAELAERTRYLATFDAMTGLANRSAFQAQLSAMTETEPNGATLGALLLIDLDGFKEVNDTFGHARGDLCLKEAAERLRQAARDAALVARIGGDEFAVLLSAGEGPPPAAVARRIVDALEAAVAVGDLVCRVGASVGLATGAASADDIFARADMALYAAKAAGKSTFRTDGDLAKQDAA